MLDTLQKIAQADLCTSCMNGGSTRAKKHHQCLAARRVEILAESVVGLLVMIYLLQLLGVVCYLVLQRCTQDAFGNHKISTCQHSTVRGDWIPS